jgi:hypothetical protein
MNWNKFFVAFVAAFIFLFLFGFLWYGTLMQGAHQEVPTLLRPESDFKHYFGWLLLGHIVMAFFFTLLCARCNHRRDLQTRNYANTLAATWDFRVALLDELSDSSRPWLSHAGGMGTAHRHVAVVAAPRGD